MELRKVTAIIRSDTLDRVEERLQNLGVKGLTVTNVKGFGEYANFFTHTWLVTHSRIEIFAEKTRAEQIAGADYAGRAHGWSGRRHRRHSAGRENFPHPHKNRGAARRDLGVESCKKNLQFKSGMCILE